MLMVPFCCWRILGLLIVILVAMISAQNTEEDYLPSIIEKRLSWSPRFMLTRLRPRLLSRTYDPLSDDDIVRHFMHKRGDTESEEPPSPGKRLYVARIGKRRLFAARVG